MTGALGLTARAEREEVALVVFFVSGAWAVFVDFSFLFEAARSRFVVSGFRSDLASGDDGCSLPEAGFLLAVLPCAAWDVCCKVEGASTRETVYEAGL